MLRFRGKDVLRISKYNMLMFIILGLLGLGISVGYLCRHVPAFKGLEHSISYTIFAMLFIFGITIGANQSLLNNIGEFGIQAAILAIFAPVSVAGINSMDVCLPVISRYSGKNIVPVAIIHGIILEISVPLLISLFCK